MHPIEHLRYLARCDDLPPAWLVPEAADALQGLARDRSALVMACRTLVSHHRACGPLWWLCGHLLGAREPWNVVDDLLDRFTADATDLQLSLALTGVTLDAVAPRIVEATMAGPDGVLTADEQPVDESKVDTEVWVVAPLGTLVPREIWNAATDGTDGSTPRCVPLASIDRIIRPGGVERSNALHGAPDVPFVPELLPRG